MFDLTSSKLLILALVALVVVGPKDLPVLLRAVGKYLGIVRRQANEFRAYFDEAMREQDLAALKAEMEAVKRDVSETVASAGRAIEGDVNTAKSDFDAVAGDMDRAIETTAQMPAADAAATATASDAAPRVAELVPMLDDPRNQAASLPHHSPSALPEPAAKAGV